MKLRIFTLCMLFAFLISPAYAQDGGTDSDLNQLDDEIYLELNTALIGVGTRPLSRNETLDAIAQQIADELGATGTYTSVPRVLADELDYPRWPDNGQRVINEAINLIGTAPPPQFAAVWQDPIAEILATTFYREVGIGVAPRVAVEGGTVQNVYVVVMGAQPNTLPVIINHGEDTVYSQEVNLYIHNELSLAYETEPDIIQRAINIRIANSEAGLEDAEWISWDEANFAMPWKLEAGAGEKTVWVEFEDEKGTRVRSSSTVTLEEPAVVPTTTPIDESVTLSLTYASDTLTLSVNTDLPTVDLSNLYFTWLDDTRVYELKNANDLFSVNLQNFDSTACIQIRLLGLPKVPNADCATLYLEASEFAELSQVFWSDGFGQFSVLDGLRFLGACNTTINSCEIRLH
ncbi:MAG: hypothetical protein H6673_05425 [Anaerolineales bacterium]|nr:hypothetical protein [Anaerolineales bacterium]